MRWRRNLNFFHKKKKEFRTGKFRNGFRSLLQERDWTYYCMDCDCHESFKLSATWRCTIYESVREMWFFHRLYYRRKSATCLRSSEMKLFDDLRLREFFPPHRSVRNSHKNTHSRRAIQARIRWKEQAPFRRQLPFLQTFIFSSTKLSRSCINNTFFTTKEKQHPNMHSTARTTTTLLLVVSMCLTPTTGFMIATSPRTGFGLVFRDRNTHLFDTEDEANEWYTPPTTTSKGAIRRPVKTSPREHVISSAEQLQEFINPADEDDRLTIVKYHASW